MCPAMNWEGKNNNIKTRTPTPLLGSIPMSFPVYYLFQSESENRDNSSICFLMEGGGVSASRPCASLTHASQTHCFKNTVISFVLASQLHRNCCTAPRDYCTANRFFFFCEPEARTVAKQETHNSY